MTERPLAGLQRSGATPGPIDVIALADRKRQAAAGSLVDFAGIEEPDLQPAQAAPPVGLRGLLDSTLSGVRLPTLLELASALEQAEAEIRGSGAVEPGMSGIAADVLADEQRKLMRYLDLSKG